MREPLDPPRGRRRARCVGIGAAGAGALARRRPRARGGRDALCVVVLPDLPRRLVSAQVEGLEADLANAELLGGGVLRGRVLGQALVLEHVHERCLPGVVEPEEQDLRVLVPQPQARQDVVEEVDDERHDPKVPSLRPDAPPGKRPPRPPPRCPRIPPGHLDAATKDGTRALRPPPPELVGWKIRVGFRFFKSGKRPRLLPGLKDGSPTQRERPTGPRARPRTTVQGRVPGRSRRRKEA